MQHDSTVDPFNLVRAIDQQKLVRAVLQRIANTTGARIYSPELANGCNYVEPNGHDNFEWLSQLALKKHTSQI